MTDVLTALATVIFRVAVEAVETVTKSLSQDYT